MATSSNGAREFLLIKERIATSRKKKVWLTTKTIRHEQVKDVASCAAGLLAAGPFGLVLFNEDWIPTRLSTGSGGRKDDPARILKAAVTPNFIGSHCLVVLRKRIQVNRWHYCSTCNLKFVNI